MKVVVIQGPNLNMLGHRENHIYGNITLDKIHEQMSQTAKSNSCEIEFFQSNLEGEIIDRIQECLGTADAIIINPAAYTHTSIAIADALKAVSLPTIEVHISNIHKREDFRSKSITASSCYGQIVGFGPFGYHLALLAVLQLLNDLKKLKEQEKTK